MNKFKKFLAKTFFKDLFSPEFFDASGTGGATGRELASEFVKPVGFKSTDSDDFEDPEFSMEDIQAGYDTDSYIRQGVDKYVDQIFKEGYTFYGTDSNIVEYLNLRLAYIAEATEIPTLQFLMGIAEDIVKYGNCMLLKSRSNDPNAFPQGLNIVGLYGGDPVAGYNFANPITMKVKRDKNGTPKQWQQDCDGGTKTFKPEDVVHFYYKREHGYAYGTSFLVPVIPDVRALRRAEENVLKMMYRNIYPFYHIAVGTEEQTGTAREVAELQDKIEGMDLESGIVTTERVQIKPVALDQVINADPYLKYMESRVFSGLGIPEIMFGRGSCYDVETETLTNHGWKLWDQITSEDKIGTYNPNTNVIEFHKPNHDILKYVSHYVGDIVHFHNANIDIKVTPEHDMWVCTNVEGQDWRKVKAIDLYKNNWKGFYFTDSSFGIQKNENAPSVIKVERLESNYPCDHTKIPRVVTDFSGKQIVFKDIDWQGPYLSPEHSGKYIEFSSFEFCEFLAYFVSFGILDSEDFYIYFRMDQNRFTDTNIVKCLDALNLKHTILREDGKVEITIYHESLWRYLRDNVGMHDISRSLSRKIIDLPRSLLSIFIRTLKSEAYACNSFDFCSRSDKLISDIQEICVKLGYHTEMKYGTFDDDENKINIVEVHNSFLYCSKDSITLEPYDNIVYCFNVPNHLFVTRRHGKVAIQGNTANRSTGDNMTAEMADRIRAISKTIEMFFNNFVVKELLMEGGYDPILNPDQNVEFRFNDNDVDVMIKKEVHAIYKYEHNAISEDEMRNEIGMDPIPDGDRERMFVELITRETLRVEAELDAQVASASASSSGTKETDNKQKNSGGTPKSKNSISSESIGLIKDTLDELEDFTSSYVLSCYNKNTPINSTLLDNKIALSSAKILTILKRDGPIHDYENLVKNTALTLRKHLNNDLIAGNTLHDVKNNLDCILDVQFSMYKNNILESISNKQLELIGGTPRAG